LLDFEIKACTAIFIGMEGVYKIFFQFFICFDVLKISKLQFSSILYNNGRWW